MAFPSGRCLALVATLALAAGCGRAQILSAPERPAVQPEAASALAKRHPTGPGWYAVQLHCHSTYSDGHQDVPGLIAAAKREGLDVLGISDHDSTTQWLDPAATAERELLMLRSQEVEGVNSHNHMGLHGMNGITPIERGLPRDDAFARATARQATIVINHPTNSRYPWDPFVFDARASAVEVWNSWEGLPDPDLGADDRAIAWWSQLLTSGVRVAAVAGADYHMAPQHVGSPCTLVYAPERTQAAILGAIRAGHTILAHDPYSARVELTTEAGGMAGDEVPAYSRFVVHAVGAAGLTVRVFRGATQVVELPVKGADWREELTLPAGAGAPFVYARLDGFSPTGNHLRSMTGALYLQ
ncbi:MAG: hypothetical protein JWM80_3017 [Cyanobacteria bacterium RYN_339]|nr:hypothetical protein [Cyanobacteria bacterium RYN_339]